MKEFKRLLGNLSFFVQLIIVVIPLFLILCINLITENQVISYAIVTLLFIFVFDFQIMCFKIYFKHRFKYSKKKKLFLNVSSNLLILGISIISQYMISKNNYFSLIVTFLSVIAYSFFQQKVINSNKFDQIYILKLFTLCISFSLLVLMLIFSYLK